MSISNTRDRNRIRRRLPCARPAIYGAAIWAIGFCPALSLAFDDPATTQPAPLSLEQPNGSEPDPMDEPLVTDRPDFTESTLTIPAGHLQLESGYTFTYDREGDRRAKDHTFPEILLRVGIVEDVELRVEWAGWSFNEELFSERNDNGRTVNVTNRVTGVNDLGLGFKFHLLDQDGWQPDFGIIAKIDVPTGNQGLSTGDVDPFLGLLWAYDLDERSSLAGNLNFAVPTDADGRFFETSASLTFAYSITDDVGAYLEYFGFYPTGNADSDAHFINGGFTYVVTKDLQFDIRVGHGLNEEADDLFAGAGFSIRY